MKLFFKWFICFLLVSIVGILFAVGAHFAPAGSAMEVICTIFAGLSICMAIFAPIEFGIDY